MKGKLINILLIVIFVAGLSLLLYPTVSDYYNSVLQNNVIVEYAQELDEIEEAESQKILGDAYAYNADLADLPSQLLATEELKERYYKMLSSSNRGVMAYVEIPAISVTLPIAHGTGEDTLRKFVGHVEWSSLPVGGESTHCVISGHRGLPSSELFTNIDHLELGDYFYIHVYGQTLEYQVDHIAVVEPHDYSLLQIQEGKDYTTLVTCTPYGINSHRLLVRGVRIGGEDTPDVMLSVRNEVTPVNPLIVTLTLLGGLSLIVFLGMIIRGKKGDKCHEKE